MEDISRVSRTIDFEAEHEEDVIFYRKVYFGCGEDSHDEATFGYFLLSEAKDGDEYQEVTTSYTIWINYDKRTNRYSFSEDDDVLSDEEVKKIVEEEEPRLRQFAVRWGYKSLHRISRSEFYDVLGRFCNIDSMQALINDMYRRLNA